MWNLEFRAPGRATSAGELVARAWPQATPQQRDKAFAVGEVRVAGHVVRASHLSVAAGTRVQVVAREGRLGQEPATAEILQRGEDFCVVNKPAGWPSHEATPGGLDARALVAKALDCSVDTLWPVHRLDADVAGAWLIALSKQAASRLSLAFAEDDVRKEYRAITPMLPWREGRFRAGIGGKAAETIFRIIESKDESEDDPRETCEVSLTLVTGRTHQLRLHLAGARCPIVGDSLYGGTMAAGGLRLYSHSIAIEAEGIEATAPEPRGFHVDEPIYDDRANERADGREAVEIEVSHATAVALAKGHPWVLTDTETTDVAGLRPGSMALVRSVRGKAIGQCLIEGPGKIAARVWSLNDGANRRPTSVSGRVDAALKRRAQLLENTTGPRATTSFRLINGEADGLPGLMVDRVGDELRVLSMWRGSQGIEDEVIDRIRDALGAEAPVVMVRHFVERPKGQFLSTLAYRGMPSEAPFVVQERGLSFEVDTGLSEPFRSRPGFGLYIDQRRNRERVAKHIRAAGGGKWLNLFCHTGAFSVAALDAGADQVTSVDLSKPYLRTLERNLELNNIAPNRHTSMKMDAQRYVEKWTSRDRFDGIILDPPTAAAAGKQFWSVRKGQAQLVERCLSHLAPKGALLVCRNDHGAKESLRDLVNAAAKRGGVKLQAVGEAGAGPDFPSLKGFREGDAFDGVIATRK